MANQYRTAMEVLKWTSPEEAVHQLTVVSRCFLKVCDSEELWFSYIESSEYEYSDIEHRGLNAKEDFWKLRHIAEQRKVVLVSEGVVYLYDCIQNTIIEKTTIAKELIDKFSGAAYISNKELFVCGGETKKTSALILDLNTLSVRNLPSMQFRRSYPAVIYLRRQMYVFGGYDGRSTSTAERYDKQTGSWTRLPNMLTARSSFNACSQRQLVYLCGGHVTACEVFDTQTESYSPIPFHLSQQNWTISFLYHEELIIVINSTFFYPNREDRKEYIGHLNMIP